MISVKTPGKEIESVSWVELSNPTFKVSEKGRQRVLRDNVRNVHAWVVGDWTAKGWDCEGSPFDTTGMQRAIYDPWKGDSFVDAKTLEPVHSAKRALVVGKKVYYQP